MESFTSPPINASQIQNFTVTSTSGEGGSVFRSRRLGAGSAAPSPSPASNAIIASYAIAINSQFPAAAYSTQLTASVNSGNFNSYIATAAMVLGIPPVNITAGPVAVGKQTHFDRRTSLTYFIFCYQLLHRSFPPMLPLPGRALVPPPRCPAVVLTAVLLQAAVDWESGPLSAS